MIYACNLKIKAFKKIGYVLFLFLLSGALVSCGSKKGTIGGYNDLEDLINNKEFLIEQQWVQPLGSGMIDLMGSPNFMRFKGNQVQIFLPYFGARHAGGSYGSDEGGIIYEGPMKSLKVTKEQDSRIEINFEGRHGTENLQFNITMFSNGNSESSVTSSERNRISYRGIVRELPASK